MQGTGARPDNRGMPHLITPGELNFARDSGRPVRLLDVRWRLDAPEGRPEYIDGHLPEAVFHCPLDLSHGRRPYMCTEPDLGSAANRIRVGRASGVST